MKVISKNSISYLLAIAVLASLLFAPVTFAYAEDAYIEGVPYYQQQSAFYCAFTSLGMVFDYYGPHIPAGEPIAVENMPAFFHASRGKATEYFWTGLTRETHFSNLSTSYEFYEGARITGYNERDLGYAAFWYGSEISWLEDLKDLIDKGYPIIVHQWFDFEKVSGHVRVVIGYDDITKEVIFHDPWDRGQSALLYWGQGTTSEDRTLGEESRLSYEDFINLWDQGLYSATFAAPWEVDTSVESVANDEYEVTATVTYPCPEPFDGTQFPASPAKAIISLPEGFILADGETATKETDLLYAGDSFSVSWRVVGSESPGEYSFSVQAEGIITGFDGHWNPYIDRIGGVGEASLRLPLLE